MEYRPDYDCHRFRRTCRKQVDGKCGWDEDEERRVERCLDRREFFTE